MNISTTNPIIIPNLRSKVVFFISRKMINNNICPRARYPILELVKIIAKIVTIIEIIPKILINLVVDLFKTP